MDDDMNKNDDDVNQNASNNLVKISFRVSKEVQDKFQGIADKSKVPVSMIYRMAFSKYLSESDDDKELAAFEVREMKRKEYFGCLNKFSDVYTQIKRLGQNVNQFLIKIRTGHYSSADADQAEKVLCEAEDVLKEFRKYLLDYSELEADFQPGGMYSGYGK